MTTTVPNVMTKDILSSLLHRIATGETIERSFDYCGELGVDSSLLPLVVTGEPIKSIVTAINNIDVICKGAARDKVTIARTFIVDSLHRAVIKFVADGSKGTCQMSVRNAHDWENPQFTHVAGAIKMLSNMVRNEPYMVVELEVSASNHRIIRHKEIEGLPFTMTWNAPARFPSVSDADAMACEQVWNAVQMKGDSAVTITTPTIIITFDYSEDGNTYSLYIGPNKLKK